MKNKLNCIMLVDDDEANNFLNKRILDRMDCAEQLQIMENGLEAIEYIKKGMEMKESLPKLIFLDLNMPIMNGWEFLIEFNKLGNSIRKMTKIVILTTSLNPDDKTKAESLAEISGYLNKPLRPIFVSQVLKDLFDMD